jgi:hypothetical protein
VPRLGNFLDLAGNELRGARVGSVGSLPPAAANAGVLVFFGNTVYWSDGTTWQAAMSGGGTPTGSAGGALTGTYPNPTLANGAVTAAAQITDAILTLAKFAPSASDAAAGTASLRSLGTGAAQAAAGDDARITGAVQASTKNQANGVAGLDGGSKVLIAQIPTGQTGTTVPFGNDARFTDQRVPTDGSVTGGPAGAGVKIAAGTITDVNVAAANKDGAAGTASLRTLGTGAAQAAAGNDSRLSDQRVPTDGSVTGGTAGAGVKIAALTITNANIAAGAAIALSKLATDPLARANHTGTQTASTISDLAAVVQAYRLDQFAAATAPISGVTPTLAAHLTTKAYVDGLKAGTDFKDSVRAATTAALPAVTAAATTLTGSANGALPAIDGVTLAVGESLLVKDQAAPAQNGIYVVTQVGSGAAPFILTRRDDADNNGEISVGALTYVQEGTANGLQQWVATATTAATWVPGTSGSTWGLYFAVTAVQAGAGLTASGNVLAVGQGTGITVNANDVAVDTAVVARKFISAAIGDGVAVAFVVNHALANQWVHAQVVATGSPFDEIITDIERTDANNVTVRFSTAPAAGSFRVIVIG